MIKFKSTTDFSSVIFALELTKSCKIRSFLLQMKNDQKDEKVQHLQDIRDDQYGYEFRILQAENSEKNITSATVDGSDNGNIDSLTQDLHDEISTICNACA